MNRQSAEEATIQLQEIDRECFPAIIILPIHPAFIGGGEDTTTGTINNHASGLNSAITGGHKNVIGTGGDYSAIGGGNYNTITGVSSAIPGGTYLKLTGRSFGFNGQTSTTVMDLTGQSQIAIFNDVNILIGNEDSSARALRFYSPTHSTTLSTSTSHFTSFQAGVQSVDVKYTLPLSDGLNGQVLTTNGSGQLSWTPKGTGGGLALNWYAEDTNSLPIVKPSAQGIGSVSHGEHVSAKANHSDVGGGTLNIIDTLADFSVIAGGDTNSIHTKANHATIGGGRDNLIDTNSAYSAIAGGGASDTIRKNTAYAFLGGGQLNFIDTSSHHAFLGGGLYNRVSSPYSVIVGGDSNLIGFGLPPTYSFIGGGLQNDCQSGGLYNTIVGGKGNVQGGATSFIGGGESNHVGDMGVWNTIVGGKLNFLGDPYQNWPNAKAKNYSFLGGGLSDTLGSSYSVLIGGNLNRIDTNSDYSFLGGGYLNAIKKNSSYSFLGGGYKDTAFGLYNVVVGGDTNAIRANPSGHGTSNYSIVGGGKDNFVNILDSAFLPGHVYPSDYAMPQYVTVVGGRDNCVYGHYAALGGGWHNFSPGAYSCVPGGMFLNAGDYQTVVGRCNLTDVSGGLILNNWKSADRLPFNSPPGLTKGQHFVSGNYWTFIVGNGSIDSTALPGLTINPSNAFMIADTGYSMVTNANGSGGASGVPNPRAMMKGGTYTDNVIDAWGIAQWKVSDSSFVVVKDFGCTSIARTGGGTYQITMNLIDPITGGTYTMGNASVTVTLMSIGNAANDCCIPIVGPVSGNSFTIKIGSTVSCGTLQDHSFTFHVTGR